MDACVQHLEEVLDLGLAHRRGQAPEPGRRQQDAVVDELAIEPVQPGALGLRGDAAAVVNERALGRVQTEAPKRAAGSRG